MPLACQYYSELEVAAMHQKDVTLIEKGEVIYQGKVKTLTTKDGKEFLVTPEDKNIPLDNVEQVIT
ncbi:hypothetical protein J3998_06075 [Thiomicrorhabdus sp. 6S2-11]|uniref:Uncharacterized protein n=1 Tax=Thiomicrorhabdus marina TaxID=2818442 RepID=A0ABS3Q488_9GAMM|nr:hypothetical protein [Thiomicrorhabdus marina]MBO1927139.1 hypothetical protein [Thiomicrorhabdus marina]